MNVLTCFNIGDIIKNILKERRKPRMKKIVLKWKAVKTKDNARVSAMYCFKNCDKNQN